MKFTYNDGGRAQAGYQGKAGDCVVRAIAIAAEMPYADVYAALALCNQSYRGRKAKGVKSARSGVFTSGAAFKQYMQSIGWKFTPAMAIGSGCKVHLRDGELPMGRIICKVSRHLVAVIDGVIHDTHDCSRRGTRCVYGYYQKAG